MSSDENQYLQCLTDQGRKAMRDDTQLDDGKRLILEVMSRVGAISEQEYAELEQELLAHYGSFAAAILAIKCGDVWFSVTTRGMK